MTHFAAHVAVHAEGFDPAVAETAYYATKGLGAVGDLYLGGGVTEANVLRVLAHEYLHVVMDVLFAPENEDTLDERYHVRQFRMDRLMIYRLGKRVADEVMPQIPACFFVDEFGL